MVDIKVGDKYDLGYRDVWEVAYVGKQLVVLTRGEDEKTYLISSMSRYNKIEPFFEVGKTYRNPQWPNSTFNVHYVGFIGATRGNKRYAAGRLNTSSGPYAFTRDHLHNWTEV